MWSVTRISSIIASCLVSAVFVLGLVGCRSDDEDNHIVLTVAHYLEPNVPSHYSEVGGGYMTQEWLLKGESDRGETWYLDFHTLHGFEFEWGVEQRVRFRTEDLPPMVGTYDFYVEEVYSTSAAPLDEPFVWEWIGGISSYKALERVDGQWQMDVHPENRELDDFRPRVLEPVSEDVDTKLWRLYGNSQLGMVTMTLQYSGDPATDPLTVLDVKIGGELPRDPAEYE